MVDETFIVRQSKKKQVGFVVLSGAMILWYFVGPYEKTRIIYEESPKLTIVLGIIFFGLFFYFLNELITRKAEIILDKLGIELREKGFFAWDLIESFSTYYYRYSDNSSIDLILNVKEIGKVKFDITNLEKNKDEIADLIMEYKGSSNIFFLGHN